MQLNFAFKPSAAMEFLPKVRPAVYQAPKAPLRGKPPSGGPRGDDAHRSFKASLHEADRRYEEAARPQQPDNVRRAVNEDRQGCSGSEARADAAKPESDTKKTVERDKPGKTHDESAAGRDESTAEVPDQMSTHSEDHQEHIVGMHAGSEAMAVSLLLTETADPAAGLHSSSNGMPGMDAAAGASAADIPVDSSLSASGADSSDPKTQPAGANQSLIKPGPEAVVGISDPEVTAGNKTEPATSTSSGADKDKLFDDLLQAASRPDHPGKSSPEGRPGTNAVAPLNGEAGERLAEKIQALQNPAEGTDAGNQKHHGAKGSRIEDAAVARTSEAFSEQQSAGRVQGENQQTRDGDTRTQPVGSDEALPKLAKVTSGSKDSAFMHHQEQNFDRLMEQATPTREKEAALGTWRAQTLDQIVNKAVYHLKNGQNEVLIDLKPEFLGQVRLQIVTHEHQVSVRIMAELPMVKEMLENNLQQLKADLQQQGLEVDEIEVSVSADSQHNAQSGKMKSGSAPPANPEVSGGGDVNAQPAPEPSARMRSTNSAVDMFV